MKYTYKFVNESKTIEVSEEELKMLRQMDADQDNQDRREEYHCTTGLDTQNDYGRWNESRQDDENSFKNMMLDRLPAALNMLKPMQRRIIILRYYGEKGQEEIAAILGIDQSNVSRRLKTAEKNLKKFLEKTA